MPDDKDQGQGQSSQSQDQLKQNSNQNSFPYEETTTRIRKSEDIGSGEKPKDFPKETKSSDD